MNCVPSGKVFLMLIYLAVAACRSSPLVHYYLLSADPQSSAVSAESKVPAIVIGPIVFPQYLDRPQLVIRGRATEVVFSELHRWAEPLDRHFLSILAENVASRLDSDHVYTFPVSSGGGADCRLKGEVTRFDVDDSGRAELAIRWQVVDGGGAVLVSPRRSRYTETSAPGDVTEAVEALAATVAAFSVEVAEALENVSWESVPSLPPSSNLDG